MAKKMEAREDRLSDLPDSILIHILSLLCEDSKKVVRTSVLSKRWQFLWMSVPVSLEIRIPDDTYITPPEEDPLQRKESNCLRELFHSVAHVEKLELGPWCIQYLSILELEGWQPPPSSWKFLQLTTKLKQLNYCGICSFLQSSSDLETLVIDGYEESRDLLLRYTNKDEQTRRFETYDFNCSFLHLKTIKILNFSRSVMPLVKYLLKHATVLEKFIIAARRKRSDVSPDYYFTMQQDLLSFPRSSPHASVIFSYR